MASEQLKGPLPHNKLCGLLTNKAVSDKALIVVGDTVGFAPANYLDPKQIWTAFYPYKDKGDNSFMLVNEANINFGMTVKAIQSPLAPNKPVRIVDFKVVDPRCTDHTDIKTLLWTEQDGCNGFMVIREFMNNALVLDAQNGQQVIAANYNRGDSQLWKFKPNM